MELLERRRPLRSAAEVMAPLSPRRPDAVAAAAARAADDEARTAFFGRRREDEAPLTLAETIDRTLGELLCADDRVLVFGEDVGAKGGVYGVTRGLQRKAGASRVFDTLLDEQSILGLALGAAVSGLVPIPEIQYLAYLHNAEDQLRGEAASLSLLLQRAVPQRHGRAHRRLRLPEAGSAATSTTTTPWPCCATSPAS